jgi:DNA-binding CsgD family transcriptional regulator
LPELDALAFGDVAVTEPDRLPPWAHSLRAALARAAPGSPPARPFWLFEQDARDWLVTTASRLGIELAGSAVEDLVAALGVRLARACAAVLGHELATAPELAKLSRALGAAPAPLRGGGDAWSERFSFLPGLARVVGVVYHNWKEASAELLLRLDNDLGSIVQELLAGRAPGAVVRVQPDTGDLHGGGRSVALLTFSSGDVVVYKPKDLRIAKAFIELCAELNQTLSAARLPVRRLLALGSHAWEEAIPWEPCANARELGQFDLTLGMLLRLFQLLDARDLWLDNLIAHRDQPVFIDLETLLQPRGQADPRRFPDVSALRVAADLLEDSVAPLSLLAMPTPLADGVEAEELGVLAPPGDHRTPFRFHYSSSGSLRPPNLSADGFITFHHTAHSPVPVGTARDAAAAAARILDGYRVLLGADHPLAPSLVAEYLGYAGPGGSTLDPTMRQAAVDHLDSLLLALEDGTLPDDPALAVHIANVLGAWRAPRTTVCRLMNQAMSHGPLDQLAPHGIVTSWAAIALVCVDELQLAEVIADGSGVAALNTGSIHGRGLAAFARALVSVELGVLDPAVRDAHTALDLASSAVPTAVVWSAALLMTALRQRGDLTAAQRTVAVVERAAEEATARGIGLQARAELQLALGRPEDAWRDALSAATALDRDKLRDHPLSPWRLAAASAGAQLGRHDQAVEYADEELSLARRAGAPRSIGRALVTRAALAARKNEELELLEEAVEVLVGSSARLVHAHALQRLGSARLASGLRTAARESLLEALELAEICGAPPLAETVRGELRCLGIRPRRAARSGVASLTPRERRIVKLAVACRTNREIARELHITTSTVEYHLTRAYRKLGVRSRSELRASNAL